MRFYRFCLVLLTCGGMAVAQTTQPPDDPSGWAQVVRALADGLVDVRTDESLREILPPGVAIRQFDRLEPEDRLSLREQTTGAVVVAALAYTASPSTLAADLDLALREATHLPESAKAPFLIDPDAAAKRANETAAQWVATTLQPGVEQPVGVIVVWKEVTPESTDENSPGQLLFILFKGRESSLGQHQIIAIVYGGTQQILR